MQEGTTDPGATHVPANEGRSYWLTTDLHTFKVVGEDTGGEFEFMDDGRTSTAGTGEFVYLPKDRLHMHGATDTSSVPPPPEMPELQRIVETAQKYGIEAPLPPEQPS